MYFKTKLLSFCQMFLVIFSNIATWRNQPVFGDILGYCREADIRPDKEYDMQQRSCQTQTRDTAIT